MKIIYLNPTQSNDTQIKFKKDTTSSKINNTLSRDTISFGTRTYDNRDPNTQLYRGVGATEIQALCEGRTIEGASYATSNPKGYRGGNNWTSRGGYGKYFIAFNKNKIEFNDHRDYDEDTRYLVDYYNLADVESIRIGQNNHGELIYSINFENDKKNDILAKKRDIKDTLVKLKKLLLTKEEKEVCIDNLESYSKEFPRLNTVIKIAKCPMGRYMLKYKENYFTQGAVANDDKELIALVKSMTPEKVNEYGVIRDAKEYSRIFNIRLDSLTDDGYSQDFKLERKQELKIEVENVKVKLKKLLSIENKNNSHKFEIASLEQILDKCKTVLK